MPGQPFSFIVDATGTGGLGDIIIDIVHDKQSISYRIEDIGRMRYRISFMPRDAGKYRVYVYFNGSDVRGSPFSLRVGSQKGSRRSKESTSSLERSKVSSLERKMNGINVSSTKRSSPVQKTYSSPTYKSPSPTHSPFNKSSSSFENSSSYHHSSSSLNNSRSSHNQHSSRNLSSPSVIRETREKEIFSSTYNRSSPNMSNSSVRNTQSPSFIKESKDIYSSTSLNRSRSPNPSPIGHGPNSPTIKESKDIYQSGSLNRSRSPTRSPMSFGNPQSPVKRNFSPRTGEKDVVDRRVSTENGVVDTSSNVKGNHCDLIDQFWLIICHFCNRKLINQNFIFSVSSMISGTSRRDSWDAIAKTKSLLSYGSLESLANLTNNGAATEHTSSSNYVNNNYRNGNASIHQNSSSNYSSTQKFTSEYGTSQKYGGESQNGRLQTHSILKNKNNNHYKSVDAIDSAHERHIHNGVSEFRTVSEKNTLVAGNALEMLPVHKPTSFTLDSSLDSNNVSVLITGEIHIRFFHEKKFY